MQGPKVPDHNAEFVSLVNQVTNETRLLIAELHKVKEALNEVNRRLSPMAD